MSIRVLNFQIKKQRYKQKIIKATISSLHEFVILRLKATLPDRARGSCHGVMPKPLAAANSGALQPKICSKMGWCVLTVTVRMLIFLRASIETIAEVPQRELARKPWCFLFTSVRETKRTTILRVQFLIRDIELSILTRQWATPVRTCGDSCWHGPLANSPS